MFGATPAVFLGITVIFMGGCAIMTGQALARTWRPLWYTLPYMFLLGAGDRFLVYALFNGQFLSLPGYLLDSATLFLFAMLAHRVTRAGQMVSQYPWLYKRIGLFRWSENDGSPPNPT
ncbi:hypothetical protein CWS72_22895 [Telmatospirillum siberiense]|uniref:DUF6867 domain-containing protein n=2 Tax=Telmatospirillum siberiense TaxID=382514 RepID=A0A2N3PPA8_9PROT|nr:hypothetical protein CWS72_22895 [Telmatospirillum siberiense]